MAHPKDPDYPHPSSLMVTKVMKAVKRANTKPEVLVRSKLHSLGYRFRKDFIVRTENRRCRPDIVFTKKRLAIFIDGCFWHHCPEHGHVPKSNTDYWKSKFHKNTERDALDSIALEASGWRVLRFWEHSSVHEIVSSIQNTIYPPST